MIDGGIGFDEFNCRISRLGFYWCQHSGESDRTVDRKLAETPPTSTNPRPQFAMPTHLHHAPIFTSPRSNLGTHSAGDFRFTLRKKLSGAASFSSKLVRSVRAAITHRLRNYATTHYRLSLSGCQQNHVLSVDLAFKILTVFASRLPSCVASYRSPAAAYRSRWTSKSVRNRSTRGRPRRPTLDQPRSTAAAAEPGRAASGANCASQDRSMLGWPRYDVKILNDVYYSPTTPYQVTKFVTGAALVRAVRASARVYPVYQVCTDQRCSPSPPFVRARWVRAVRWICGWISS